MPKNKGKGGKNRRRGKNENESTKRELILKEPQQEYAIVKALTGNGKLTLHCMDGVERVGLIRGKLRKKVWIGVGDTILVSLRDYQDNMCDAVLKYNNDEVRILKSRGDVIDVGSENKSEVIEFKHDSGIDYISSKSDILGDIMGAHNPNRPILNQNEDSEESDSDDDEEDEETDDEEEEDEAEEEEEDTESEKDIAVTFNRNDVKESLKLAGPINYSMNTCKQEASNLSNLAAEDETGSESEEETKLPADLLDKLKLLKQEFKAKR